MFESFITFTAHCEAVDSQECSNVTELFFCCIQTNTLAREIIV